MRMSSYLKTLTLQLKKEKQLPLLVNRVRAKAHLLIYSPAFTMLPKAKYLLMGLALKSLALKVYATLWVM